MSLPHIFGSLMLYVPEKSMMIIVKSSRTQATFIFLTACACEHAGMCWGKLEITTVITEYPSEQDFFQIDALGTESSKCFVYISKMNSFICQLLQNE